MPAPKSRPGRRSAAPPSRRRTAVAVAAAGLATLAAPAVAGAEWSAVGPFSSPVPPDANGVPAPYPSQTTLGTVTFGFDGTLTGAVGATFSRTTPSQDARIAAVGARRPGASWPQGIPSESRLPALSPATTGRPAVSHGEDGSTALILGSRTSGYMSDWTVAVLGDDGTWGPLTKAGPADAGLQLNARLVIDRDRRLTVVWVGAYDAAGISPVLTSSRAFDGGAWSAPKQIGTADTGRFIESYTGRAGTTDQFSGVLSRPVVAEDGSIVVSWTTGSVVRPPSGGVTTLVPKGLAVSRRAPDGTWSTPAIVTTPEAAAGGYLDAQRTATDDRGGVVTALTGVDVAGTRTTRAYVLPAGSSTWGAPTTLASAPDALAAIGTGQAVAVSRAQEGDRYVARAQTTTDGGARWSAPQTVSPDGSSVDAVSLAANRTPGMVTLGLSLSRRSDVDAGPSGVVRDWYPWSDSFTRFYDVPDAVGATVVGADAAGDTAIQVPVRYSGAGDPGQSTPSTVTVDDVSGPDIDGLTAPAAIKPKKAGAFSVEATDAFSKLGTTTWDFGDGTKAIGAKVQHAFKKAGVYTVSVTVTDEWGYPTATSATVRVAKNLGTAKAAARTAKPGAKRTVSVSRLRLSAGRVSLRSSGAAKLLVSVQRRNAEGVPVGPARTLRVQPRSAGTVVARVKGIRAGKYRVRVSGDPASAARVVRRGAILRVGR